jgi:hypothetical protein
VGPIEMVFGEYFQLNQPNKAKMITMKHCVNGGSEEKKLTKS